MPYDLTDRLVVGIASSALFDLAEADTVFREQGVAAYREHQRIHARLPFRPGVAFPFVRRLLALNDLQDEPVVEVILLSRNDPHTGLRVFTSLEHHGLPVSRAAFLQGRDPHHYMDAFNVSLFLSGHADSVRQAIAAGHPAGLILEPRATEEDPEDGELRVAFDFDGVLADDASERVFKSGGLQEFLDHERHHKLVPLARGPLIGLLERLGRIQLLEEARSASDRGYRPRLRVSIVTARNAPAHERVINTLESWNIRVNEAFFLGGIPKQQILDTLRPHIFFDDQVGHLQGFKTQVPAVHVPFGVANLRPQEEAGALVADAI